MGRRRNMRFKGLLCLFLTLILLVGTLPGTALAANDTEVGVSEETATADADGGDTTTSGTEDSDTADTSDGDIAIDVNAREKSADSTDDASDSEAEAADKDADTTETGLPDDWSPGRGARTGTDITGYIKFSNGQLSNASGTLSEDSENNNFYYGLHTFTVNWEADLQAISEALGHSLAACDCFTFTLPGDVFKSISFNITVGNTVWATVEVDAYGNGTVTFTSEVATMSQVSGTLEFSKYYTETIANKPVDWDFTFGEKTYHYEGTSAGQVVGNSVYEKENIKSASAIVDGSIYGWTPILNIGEESWSNSVTITDTLGDYHKMRTYYNPSLSTHYGYYGKDNHKTANYYGLGSGANANYYFSIAVIDWTQMRNDYNKLTAWNAAQNHTTLCYYTGGTVDGGVFDSTGILIDSKYAYSSTSIDSGYTSFMRDKMRTLRSSGIYIYMESYTDGLTSVTVSDNGYTIVFPDKALNGKSLQLYYYTEMTGVTSPSKLTNSVTISGNDVDDSVTSSITVRGGGTITGQQDYLTIYKYDSGERETLSGATFTLKKIDGYTAEFDPVTTGTDGKIAFWLLSKITTGYAGTYTLTETGAPDGYVGVGDLTLELDSVGKIIKVNDTDITSGIGTTVYDDSGDKLCWVSADGLALIVYNEEKPEPVTEWTVVKSWDDVNDQDGKRPASIQVQLYADGVAVRDPVTLNEANSWRYIFDNLPKINNGVDIVYEVKEVDIPFGYTASYSSGASGFTITNSYTPEIVNISGTKTWDDNNDQDGKRPTSIIVNLLANNAVLNSKTVTASDNWEYKWTGLPKYATGVEITYTVSEVPVSDYQAVVNGYDITNSYTPGETSRMVTKVWEDNNDQDGKRPASIQAQLYADGTAEGSAVTLDAANGWSYTWSNLPEMKDGTTIVYTVEETEAPSDYTEAYSTDGFTITNSYTPETVDVSGEKIWDDNNDQDGKRPTSITVNLLADNAVLDSKTVTASDNWEYEWTGLPKYEAGVEITYTVSEDPVSDYATAVNGYDITNSYTPGETSRTVTKVWEDANDHDGIRPESIQVQLYADGTAEGSAVTLNDKENGWSYTWNNLSERQSGEEIVYTVEETEVPSEYEASYSSDGFTITNTYRPQILVSKINSAGNELAGATLTIYEADAAGKATDTIATGKDGQELTWETTGEPQDITGIPAGTYILRETIAPNGYYAAYDILFTVNADGTVTKDSATGEVDGNTIIMTDLRHGEVMPEWVALTIGKTVTGTAGDQKQEFTFTLDLTYADGEEVTGEFAYEGSRTGTIKSGESVKLKHGELIRIYDIPQDVEYTVTESDNEGYKVEGKNAVGTIDEIGRSVQFTNHKDKVDSGNDPKNDPKNDGKTPQTRNSAVSPKTYSKGSTTTGSSVKTGDTAPFMLYGILLLIAGVGIVGFLRYRKRRKA